MPLLNLLTGLGDEERPSHIEAYLVRAHELATRPNLRPSLFQMEERLARARRAGAEVDRIQQEAVEMLISHALEQEKGLARAHWLKQAHELARGRSWARDTEKRILGEIQQIEAESYDWKQSKAEIRVPAKIVEDRIESIARGNRIEESLERFAFGGGSPVGDRRESERVVDQRARELVLVNLMNRSVHDEHGYPIRHADTYESKRNLDILAHEAQGIQWDAQFRQVALDRIGKRCAPTTATLIAFFLTELIDREQADAFARAFQHYWAGRPDEAILIAMPRVEAVLRRVLEASGGVIYDPPEGDVSGGVRGLGAVLRDLPTRVPADVMTDWWRFFRIALTEAAPGLNLRNRYAHGLAATATKQDAAIVLRICALLRFIGREATEAQRLRRARRTAVAAEADATRKKRTARRYPSRSLSVDVQRLCPLNGSAKMSSRAGGCP